MKIRAWQKGYTSKEIMTPQLRDAKNHFKKSRTHLKRK